MASITSLKLKPITVNVANANVKVEVEVTYSQFDRDANTPYRMVCTLLGHDALSGGDGAESPADDVITDGNLTPPGGQIIRADDLDVQRFVLKKTIGLDKLDEDTSGLSGSDEIKAHVQLMPIVAHATEAVSDFRSLTIE
jgi:hypothetical protein